MALDPEPIPVLTLWQPWATLIALGVKRIETRPWSTNHRGPLAIHAALRRPPLMHLPPLSRGRSLGDREHDRRTWLVIDTITDDRYKGLQPQGKRIPKRAQTPTLFRPHAGEHSVIDPETGYPETFHLPLGAIVAVCDLVDVVPMVDLMTGEGSPDYHASGKAIYLLPGGLPMELVDRMTYADDPEHTTIIEHERPFGDFRPGRFAWLLDNVRPLDPPVPFRGGQRLTRRWTQEATMSR